MFLDFSAWTSKFLADTSVKYRNCSLLDENMNGTLHFYVQEDGAIFLVSGIKANIDMSYINAE